MSTTERQHEAPDTEILLRRVVDLVNAAPKMPLSSTVRLEKSCPWRSSSGTEDT